MLSKKEIPNVIVKLDRIVKISNNFVSFIFIILSKQTDFLTCPYMTVSNSILLMGFFVGLDGSDAEAKEDLPLRVR